MTRESPAITRFTPPTSERRSLALLSALAEAPDLEAAAAFLLNDILATTGARRALLLRFDIEDEQLVLASHVGFGEPRPVELTIG